MLKRIVLTAFIVLTITSFALSAASEKKSTSALFFQYSLDNDFRQIDSIGAYVRNTQFNDNTIGSSWGATFELPIGYNNDKMSLKYSIFGGTSIKFNSKGIDNFFTIGPNATVTMLIDTYYKATMVDLGIIVDTGSSYPISEKVDAIMGASFIFDIARYSSFTTASASTSGFEEDFSQLSAKIYLGFSVSR